MSAEEQFARIVQLLEEQGKRLDRIDQRFERIDQRFERIDQYVLELRNEVARRFESLETSLRLMSSAISSIETRIQPFTKGVLECRARRKAGRTGGYPHQTGGVTSRIPNSHRP
jgi:hypothetical protein